MDGNTAPAAVATAPVDWYVDPAFWPKERLPIFARSWQFVTHESALPEPGSWVSDNLAGWPILLIRGEDGMIRGFHNVCRHRAGPLTQGEAGKCEGPITCRYHGWAYMWDGRLRAARDFGRAADFDPREFALYPVKVELWRGLVFVAIEQPDGSLADWVAPIERRLEGKDWSDLKVGLKRAHPIACNWKTYVENYLEGYHVPSIHPSLDAEIDSANYAVTMDGLVALHEAPQRDPNAIYEGLWAWMWPNLGVNVYGRGLMMERMSPVGPGQVRLDYTYLTPDGEAVSDETLAMSDVVTAEDRWVVERVQENLAAGAYVEGRLSPKHEVAVAAFQAMVRRAIAGA